MGVTETVGVGADDGMLEMEGDRLLNLVPQPRCQEEALGHILTVREDGLKIFVSPLVLQQI